jgi:hypothetical protein
MWNIESCHYYFDGSTNSIQSNQLFLDRYCSSKTRENIQSSGVSIEVLRKVLKDISTLVPDLEQTTPSWTPANSPQPLVVFGRAILQYREEKRGTGIKVVKAVVRKPNFGLCAIDKKIHLWAPIDWLIPNLEKRGLASLIKREDWMPWQGRSKHYYKYPIEGTEGIEGSEQNISKSRLSELISLCDLIQEIGFVVKPPNFLLHQELAHSRHLLNLPDEFDVAVPRLTENTNNKFLKPVKKSSKETKNKKNKSELTDKNTVESNATVTISKENQQDFITNLAQNLRMTINGGVQANLMDSDLISGRFYVYALIDPTNQNQPFYIGKGFFDRANNHFGALSGNDGEVIENHEETDVNDRIGEEPSVILDAEEKDSLDQTNVNQASRIISAKNQKILDLKSKGYTPNDLVRIVARSLSKHAAYTVESLILKSVYARESLTNIARGHHEERFRAFDDWQYMPNYDLPKSVSGELVPDNGLHSSGAHYIYVLRDPATHLIFYVGKGIGKRLCDHFSDARATLNLQNQPQIRRIQKIKSLLSNGHSPADIGRIVARVESEALAFIIESFYIKYVVGFGELTNIQPGHLAGLFRSKDDWERRHGFDLPTEFGAMRRVLFDEFLGEGLDVILNDVVDGVKQHDRLLLTSVTNPKLVGASELAVLCSIEGVDNVVKLQIQIRGARRIQLFLMPISVAGQEWIKTNFSKCDLYPIIRTDNRFSPNCWKGANNLTIDIDVAICRAIKLAKFAKKLQSATCRNDLNQFEDLIEDLPRN